jgi:hypothetical protein
MANTVGSAGSLQQNELLRNASCRSATDNGDDAERNITPLYCDTMLDSRVYSGSHCNTGMFLPVPTRVCWPRDVWLV